MSVGALYYSTLFPFIRGQYADILEISVRIHPNNKVSPVPESLQEETSLSLFSEAPLCVYHIAK